MCGIAGYFGLSQADDVLGLMNDAQKHRGPDGSGVFVDKKIGFAHRRLAIIDRQDGAQPMTSQDGQFVLIYNGEVYNYLELRAELEKKGRKFKTHSDTEVVLQSFEEWGNDCFDRFNGMFAIAIYDKQKQRLTLARDHFGIKPLYFSQFKNTKNQTALLFSSEIKSLLASKLIKAAPNDKIIYRYLKFRIHEDSSETFFAGIKRLMPGETLEIDDKKFSIQKYTNLITDLREQFNKNIPYSEEKTGEYYEKLLNSVKLRLQSEVPLGTSLSGGLDSSSVVALINKIMRSNASSAEAVGKLQNTFSAVFPNSPNDEEKYVDAVVSRHQGSIKVHKIKPNADKFKQDLLDFVKTQEEPTISTGPYAQYCVMEEAHKHVTVLLDGQGADEIMAGYIPYYFVYLKQLRKEAKYATFLKESLLSLDLMFRLGRHKIKHKLSLRKEVNVNDLLHSKFKTKYKSESFSVKNDNLKERLIEDIFSNSLPSLLRYEDKNTMRFGIEGRVPFLDKELVKFIFSLNDKAIIKNSWNKKILRDAIKEDLPAMIVKRRNKIGFTTPEQEWFLRLKNYIYSIFLSEEFISRKYFDAEEVAKAFELFVRGKGSASTMLFWRILNVELWLREYIDPKKSSESKDSIKTDFEANKNKQLDIQVQNKSYRRYSLRTDLISAKDEIVPTLIQYLSVFFKKLPKQTEEHKKLERHNWQLFISEKIIAIMQGRAYFIWDIKPSYWARTLSKFVSRTPSGIGLGSPFTMHLAIQEIGLPKILLASGAGLIGKIFNKKGIFYKIAGPEVRAIDGPTEYSVYPANVSAKLAPKDPSQVAKEVSAAIRKQLPKKYSDNFQGTVIIDANDIGRNILGSDTDIKASILEEIFADNPLGQATEQTPISVVFEK